MCSGTPIIATDVGSTKEFVTHGEEGMLFKEENFEALSHCIQKLFEDETLRCRMSTKARQRYLLHHEQGRVVKRQAEWISSRFLRSLN
jgi:glycosyltransferase involved in cell wall biosynthesis